MSRHNRSYQHGKSRLSRHVRGAYNAQRVLVFSSAFLVGRTIKRISYDNGSNNMVWKIEFTSGEPAYLEPLVRNGKAIGTIAFSLDKEHSQEVERFLASSPDQISTI